MSQYVVETYGKIKSIYSIYFANYTVDNATYETLYFLVRFCWLNLIQRGTALWSICVAYKMVANDHTFSTYGQFTT